MDSNDSFSLVMEGGEVGGFPHPGAAQHLPHHPAPGQHLLPGYQEQYGDRGPSLPPHHPTFTSCGLRHLTLTSMIRV